jgi:hypothetical protein
MSQDQRCADASVGLSGRAIFSAIRDCHTTGEPASRKQQSHPSAMARASRDAISHHPRRSWMQKSEVESCEHQDNANIHRYPGSCCTSIPSKSRIERGDPTTAIWLAPGGQHGTDTGSS